MCVCLFLFLLLFPCPLGTITEVIIKETHSIVVTRVGWQCNFVLNEKNNARRVCLYVGDDFFLFFFFFFFYVFIHRCRHHHRHFLVHTLDESFFTSTIQSKIDNNNKTHQIIRNQSDENKWVSITLFSDESQSNAQNKHILVNNSTSVEEDKN